MIKLFSKNAYEFNLAFKANNSANCRIFTLLSEFWRTVKPPLEKLDSSFDFCKARGSVFQICNVGKYTTLKNQKISQSLSTW